MDKISVLLVEDEDVLAMIIAETLGKRGFEIKIARNGVEGWSKFNQLKPDICIIDVMMPRKDGISLLQDIRKVDEFIPVIFLTAKSQTEDVLKGFEAGADDYMKKPFSMEELILRLRSILRRKISAAITTPSPVGNSCQIGPYQFNHKKLELTFENSTIALSQREGDLLALLLQHKNSILDRSTALLKLWGDDNVFNARSMDVYISRLRKHFVRDDNVKILNIRNQGYKIMD
ncbi:response regulator transcription factor [Pedobacter nutrimenti]|uniref:response regulator transcription factor n=1 Tax=Pedobacter nutrimenti TaxID=1241337 RepID=UPI00292CACE2|nr:response regulator transcription factor [Pedobacter nutrimenti]